MSSEGGTRSAVLLLRVWQDERGGGVRARLLEGAGPDAEHRTVATVAGVDRIVAAVTRWLDGFAAG